MKNGVKEYCYDAEGGSICIGNESCRSRFPNDYGDGGFSIFVNDSTDRHTSPGNQWHFVGSVEGNRIVVYNFDYYTGDELLEEGAIAVVLSGRYGVYAHTGDIWLQKWD